MNPLVRIRRLPHAEGLPLPQIAYALLTTLRGGSDQVHHRI